MLLTFRAITNYSVRHTYNWSDSHGYLSFALVGEFGAAILVSKYCSCFHSYFLKHFSTFLQRVGLFNFTSTFDKQTGIYLLHFCDITGVQRFRWEYCGRNRLWGFHKGWFRWAIRHWSCSKAEDKNHSGMTLVLYIPLSDRPFPLNLSTVIH